MKPAVIAGLILVAVGAFVVFKGLSYKSEGAAVQVGDFRAAIETRRAVPTWVGAVAIIGGAVLVLVGARRKR